MRTFFLSIQLRFCPRPDWVSTVPSGEAKFKRRSNIFCGQLVRASLDNQPETRLYLEQEFRVSFAELAR